MKKIPDGKSFWRLYSYYAEKSLPLTPDLVTERNNLIFLVSGVTLIE